MTRRFGIALSGAAALALLGLAAWGDRPSRGEGRSPPAEGAAPIGYVGSRSCAAAGCHNGYDGAHVKGGEYGVWSSRDPHARAASVLSKDRAKDIFRRWRPAGGDAATEPACLACHATPAAPGEAADDGVSCESCHGPAGQWRDAHYTRDWRGLAAAEKERQGFRPTKDLAVRINLCADCHVGRPGGEVGHDLIAAGHPRLTFEYSAYHELLPRHWIEPRYGKDFSARAWELGQAVVAGRAAELLEARARAAGPAAPPPEFADYDCYACHHGLRAPSWRQQRPDGGARPGLPAWGTWSLGLTAALAKYRGLDPAVVVPDAADALTRAMTKPHSSGGEVADAAAAAAARFRQWAAALQDDAGTLDKDRARVLLLRLAADDDPADWDQAAQTYLAVAALGQTIAKLDPNYPKKDWVSVKMLRGAVAFPSPPADGPDDFTPARFRDALKSVQSAFGD